MGRLTEIINHEKLEKLLELLMYDPDTEQEKFRDDDKKSEEKCQEMLWEIRKFYGGNEKQDDSMPSAGYNRTDRENDAYFEAGMLFGFQLYKEMEDGFRMRRAEILEILKKTSQGEKMPSPESREDDAFRNCREIPVYIYTEACRHANETGFDGTGREQYILKFANGFRRGENDMLYAMVQDGDVTPGCGAGHLGITTHELKRRMTASGYTFPYK